MGNSTCLPECMQWFLMIMSNDLYFRTLMGIYMYMYMYIYMPAIHWPSTEGDEELHAEVRSLVKVRLSMLNDGNETIGVMSKTCGYTKSHNQNPVWNCIYAWAYTIIKCALQHVVIGGSIQNGISEANLWEQCWFCAPATYLAAWACERGGLGMDACQTPAQQQSEHHGGQKSEGRMGRMEKK